MTSGETNLQLLLVNAENDQATLHEGLPLHSTDGEPRPHGGAAPAFLWDQGGDPDSLVAQRWGVLAPEGPEGDRLLSLMAPLCRHRQESQDGAPVRIYRVPAGLDGDEAARWKDRILRDESVPERDQPRYLLLLGDLDQVSLELQQVVSSDGFVGRLAFQEEGDYEAYVEKVLRWERAPAPVDRARSLFYTVHDGTAATLSGYQGLVSPGIASCREQLALGYLKAREVREVGSPEDPSVDTLLSEVAASDPTLLFTLSHGLGAPRAGWSSPDHQRALQGAMSLGRGQRLDAEAVRSRPFLPGGIWCFLACFSAGTPARSAYHPWLSRLQSVGQFPGQLDSLLASLPQEGTRPFIAALPQAALANPEGPLAVVGHVDLAWTYSFQDQGKDARYRPSRFLGLLRNLLAGRRAGVGLNALLRFFNEVNLELALLFDVDESARAARREVSDTAVRRGHLWMLRQDLAGYILLGDPAVRLAQEESRPQPVPSLATSGFTGIPWRSVPLPAPGETSLTVDTVEEAVLALLSGKEPLKELARRAGTSPSTLRQWERLYKDAGRAALMERLGLGQGR